MKGMLRPARWGITRKILLITLSISAVVWLVLDRYQTEQLQQLFLAKEQEALQKGAFDDRRLFDQYAQAIFRSAKLIAGQKRFADYLESMPLLDEAPVVPMAHLAQLPPWMPRSSIMRTFYRARYALLYDENGMLRSAYHHSAEHPGPEGIPRALLADGSVLRKLSHNQAYMTTVDGKPFLIASERIATGRGYVTLALVTPIDSAFLADVTSAQQHDTVLALVDREHQRVVASSDEGKIPLGASMEALQDDYLMAGKSFFDYGASDLNLQLTSFAPTEEVYQTIADLLSESNYQRSVLVLMMTLTFSLVMLFFVRRVLTVSRSVNYYSRHLFGRLIDDPERGDELTILNMQIETLGNEVVVLRNELHHEAELARSMAADLEARTESLSRTNKSLAREIEERKRSERERDQLNLQLQKAQRMDAIGQITGGVAHDFNNILAAILGFAELAEMRFASSDKSGSLASYLEQIKTAGGRGRDLVASMMAFSRGEAGERKVLALEQEISTVIAMLRPTIPSAIDISTVVHSQPLHVDVDPIKLQQVVMNLIVNARDGLEGEKGHIEVAVGRVDVAGERCSSCHETVSGEFIELTVRDNGRGIEPDLLAHIFEPFFSTKDVGQGSGMGLSVIHGIMHANQGHVLVESQPGVGTCFRLLLQPVNDVNLSEELNILQPPQASLNPHRARIVVVDDEVALTEFLQDLLEVKGFEVSAYNDPEVARDELCNSEVAYDLLITDQTMPQLTGIELVDAVRRCRPDLPVIMCTGYSAVASEEVARARGVDAYLPKPIDINQLEEAIVRLTQGAWSEGALQSGQ